MQDGRQEITRRGFLRQICATTVACVIPAVCHPISTDAHPALQEIITVPPKWIWVYCPQTGKSTCIITQYIGDVRYNDEGSPDGRPGEINSILVNRI